MKNDVQPEILKPIDEQVRAYNEKDIDGFLKAYCDDVMVLQFPEEVTSQGTRELQKTFSNIFRDFPDAQVNVTNRMVCGQYVIDEEVISAGEGSGQSKAVAIYHVEKGEIKKLWIMQGS